ncbi:CHASE3 domain-containing protein [Methylobacterium sp. sgz302541]|uniref:CHASE3 domain-containing protein n=1 Tax=unclassified Methylobacterium TaxID=2615210 RepID=UPI003D3575BD
MPDLPDVPIFPVSEPRRLRSLAPLVAGFLLLVAVVAATGGIVGMQRRAAIDVRHAFEQRNEIANLLSALQDAETGQRGFMLAGEDAYLRPYERAVGQIEAGLHTLGDVFAAEPAMVEAITRLRSVTAEKLAELRDTIALRKEGRNEEAMELVRSDKGRRLMEEARAVIGQLGASVADRLRIRQARMGTMANRLQFAVSGAVLLAVLLAAYAIFDARSRSRRLARAHSDLRRTHAALVSANATRERLEEQLRQSQKMEAMGQLTGGLAHDFNNMLAIIMGNLHLLKRRLGGENAQVQGYADQALDAGVRAATLTQRLLAFARKQPLTPEPIDCNRLLADMSELLRRSLGESVRVETVLAGGLWRTEADANQLENAILNLAVNARDAMRGVGRITVETANAHLDDRYAAENLGVPPGQYVMIAVSDTGAGMSPEVAARAFDPFFTTKEVGQGTGLGLSQVHGFVKQSGGHVKIYSEPGNGTAVKIYLPRRRGDGTEAPVRTADTGPVPEGNAGEIILVVEDDAGVRRMAVEALRDLRYTVIHADGAERALQLIEGNPGIALLFTDVVMPETSGKQLADAARQRKPALRVLYTTGYTRNAIVHNGIVDADVQLLGKPYTLEQLARKVRQVISSEAA